MLSNVTILIYLVIHSSAVFITILSVSIHLLFENGQLSASFPVCGSLLRLICEGGTLPSGDLLDLIYIPEA